MLDQPRWEVLTLLFSPLVGAAIVATIGPKQKDAVRWISTAFAFLSLVLAITIAGRFLHWQYEQAVHPPEATKAIAKSPTFEPQFVPGSPGVRRDADGSVVQIPHGTSWDLLPFGSGAIQFYIGIDGINLWLVVLTAVLFVPSVLVSWRHIDERVNEFFAWLLVLQTAMFGVFLSFDIVLFYVFFELSLVPLFFLIGVWGGPERRHAAGKFFIFTLSGSVITLLGVLGIVLACYYKTPNHELTFSLPRLVELVHEQLRGNADAAYWANVQFYVFLALMAGFAIKVPLVPLHTWLPLAHVEAPTAGSVDLAGVLLKVGAYGFMRLCLPLAPDVSLSIGFPAVSIMAAVGIVYGSLCAYVQDDIKKLVAYSSVSHLGLCMLGMFALNVAGLTGSLMQMINHGLSTAALFLLVGMLYERYHTRKISDYGGMARRLPLLGFCMVYVCLSSVGMPGLNGFIGEVLVLLGAFNRQWPQQWPIYAIVGASGMILGAWYLFTMLQKVFFGPVKEPATGHDGHEAIQDLNVRELVTVVPIMVLCLVIGVYPQPLLDSTRKDLTIIAEIADHARTRAKVRDVGPTVPAPPVAVASAQR